jgi:predicted hotdog family 3-hydroxylacyl-ACP dehydratase
VTGLSGPALDRPLKIEGLIPHRRPMLAVDELISLSEDEAVSRTVIRPDSFFLDALGRVEESLLFEMAAQTFAALAAARSGPGGPKAGFLAAVKRMDFFGRPEVGTAVEITVRVLSRVDDFAVVSGRAVQAGRLLAEGQVTVFVPGSAGDWLGEP